MFQVFKITIIGYFSYYFEKVVLFKKWTELEIEQIIILF